MIAISIILAANIAAPIGRSAAGEPKFAGKTVLFSEVDPIGHRALSTGNVREMLRNGGIDRCALVDVEMERARLGVLLRLTRVARAA